MNWDALQAVLTVREAAHVLRVGRNAVYGLCSSGELGHVRIGRSIRIPWVSLQTYLGSVGQEDSPIGAGG